MIVGRSPSFALDPQLPSRRPGIHFSMLYLKGKIMWQTKRDGKKKVRRTVNEPAVRRDLPTESARKWRIWYPPFQKAGYLPFPW